MGRSEIVFDVRTSAQLITSPVSRIVIPDFVAFVVSVRESGVIGGAAEIGLRAVALLALGIVIPCPVALLVAIPVSVPIVGLRTLVVISRLAREIGVADPQQFIEGGTPREHRGNKK
jgi:predicted CDP-diglyceride synthetase/phosphatidate cytidylyltransferase